MRLKRAMSIGIVSDKDVSNFRFMRILEGIMGCASSEKNYSITLCLINRTARLHRPSRSGITARTALRGIIFVYSELRDEDYLYLHEKRIPFVVINSHQKHSLSNQVKNDMEQALITALQSLKHAGKKEVAF